MRIFIASADRMLRLALQLLLESEPGMAVSGMSDRSEGLLTVMKVLQSDVLLLDYELTKQTTTELVGDVHHLSYPTKIVVLSIDPQMEATMLAAGANAFISKNIPPDDLLPTLRGMRFSLDIDSP